MNNTIDKIILKMIKYFDGDVKRINHALKVYSFSKSIGNLEDIGEAKQKILEISAVLHDIGIKVSEEKYKSSAGKYQEIEGPKVAVDLLEEFNLENEDIDRICFLISHHHTYSSIDDIDLQILIESDFIVNIFEDQIDTKTVKMIKEKYFKTKAGSEILENMYL